MIFIVSSLIQEMKPGGIIYTRKKLKRGVNYSISSNFSGLSIFFLKGDQIFLDIKGNNHSYFNDMPIQKIYGVDFGNTKANISLYPQQDTIIEYTAILFDEECLNHRLISNAYLNLSLNSTSAKPEFQTNNSISFCYWPIFTQKREVSLSIRSDQYFDTFSRINPFFKKEFKGETSSNYVVTSGMEYFVWNYNSNYIDPQINLSISLIDHSSNFAIDKLFYGNMSKNITIFYRADSEISLDGLITEEKGQTQPWEKWYTWVFIIGVIALIIISTFLFSINKDDEPSESSSLSSPEDDQDRYIDAGEDSVPLPFFQPSIQRPLLHHI